MIYLASPYSHADEAVRHQRYKAACQAAALLMAEGYRVFSPIAHSHPIEQTGLFHGSHEWWLAFDFELMRRCDEVYVLAIEGWQESRGVMAEIDEACECDIPVRIFNLQNGHLVEQL